MDLAQAGANLQLNGVTDVQPIRGFHIRAAEANGLYSRHADLGTRDLGTQRRLKRHTRVAARYDEVSEWWADGFEGSAHPCRGGTFLQQRQSVFGSGAQPCRLHVGQSLALAGELPEQVNSLN